jgi:hypothetical protein
MRRICLTVLFILSAVVLHAQEEVIFNISRKKAFSGAAAGITVFVNGAEAVKLRNGGSFIYKALIDKSKPVTVLVRSGISKREITFNLGEENKCSLETAFTMTGLSLTLTEGGGIAPGTGGFTETNVGKNDLSISYAAVQTHASDTIRQQWISKGGKIEGTTIVLGAMFTRMKTPEMSMTGTGGFFTGTVSYLNLEIPEYGSGIKTWKSSVFGYSVGDQFFGSKTVVDIGIGDPMEMSNFSVSLVFSVNAGYTIGVGKFKNETKWKGVAFELAYKPSIIYSPIENDVSLNLTGFGFDINFNSFTSNAAKLAPKAQSKFTFFMLPPINDMPFVISVGYGLTWYKQR